MKKGCVIKRTDPCGRKKVESLHVDWYYTWNLKGIDGVVVPFVPMVWGASTIPEVQGPILCFNEPDRPDQSNISVETALNLWPKKTSARLGSPATAANPIKPGWFQDFMSADPMVDFVCTHWYGPPNVDSFLKRIDDLYEKYKKPIWITEFAVAQWNPEKPMFSEDAVIQFMQKVLPELEKRPHVERYAWKTRSTTDSVMGTSALFTDDGELTALGKVYQSQ